MKLLEHETGISRFILQTIAVVDSPLQPILSPHPCTTSFLPPPSLTTSRDLQSYPASLTFFPHPYPPPSPFSSSRISTC